MNKITKQTGVEKALRAEILTQRNMLDHLVDQIGKNNNLLLEADVRINDEVKMHKALRAECTRRTKETSEYLDMWASMSCANDLWKCFVVILIVINIIQFFT